ncbi:hypothetical protein EOD39_17251 [Acipenser ruthenus]|uniref:Uncharacterized protein n=1 Tax=Acipenser ruthenus TaxID=7906 RepID=A0A444V3V8_ACIRT|nr:hypothetical protein EOD39_17251 [Acipenser ruthenus]
MMSTALLLCLLGTAFAAPLYPYGYPGQTFGNPQQPTSQNPSAAGSQTLQQQGPMGPVSIEIAQAKKED